MNIAGTAKKQAISSAGQLGGIQILILKDGPRDNKIVKEGGRIHG